MQRQVSHAEPKTRIKKRLDLINTLNFIVVLNLLSASDILVLDPHPTLRFSG